MRYSDSERKDFMEQHPVLGMLHPVVERLIEYGLSLQEIKLAHHYSAKGKAENSALAAYMSIFCNGLELALSQPKRLTRINE